MRLCPRRRACRLRGFTLLEVLVALAILAIALGAVIQAGGAHARNSAVLSERALASWLAEDLAADVAAGLVGATTQRQRVTRESGGRDWVVEWWAEALQVDAPLELPPIRRIEIVVMDTDGRALYRATSYAF